ncbi:MAG: hypothetical protein RTU63_00140 [Candidatus Thorarchaeota archaeon]
MSLENKVVAFIHIIVALAISLTQLQDGFLPWVMGNGIVLPILLIIHGFLYSSLENETWYREQMVPFIARLITTTEIETDRYLQFHRRIARTLLIFGWLVILLCQFVWTYGLTNFGSWFVSEDILTGVLAELVAYGIFFGPFILYFLILFLFAYIADKTVASRYEDISHILEIEHKWNKESSRRAKDPESVQVENDFYDRQGF